MRGRLDQTTLLASPEFKEFQQDFIAQLSNQPLALSSHYLLTQQISTWLEKEEKAGRTPPFTAEQFQKNSRNPQSFKKFFNRMNAKNKKSFAEIFLSARLKESAIEQLPDSKDTKRNFYRAISQALGMRVFGANKKARVVIADTLPPSINIYLDELKTSKKTTSRKKNAQEIFQTNKNRTKHRINDYSLDEKSINSHLSDLRSARNQLQENKNIHLSKNTMNYWFPNGLIKQFKTTADKIKIIDFIINQLHSMKSSQTEHFMQPKYPKEVKPTMEILQSKKEDETLKLYQNFQKNIALIDNSIVREALIKMFNEILILTGRSVEIKNSDIKKSLNAVLQNLNNLATLYQKDKNHNKHALEIINAQIKIDMDIIKKHFSKEKSSLENHYQHLQAAINAQTRSYTHIKFNKETHLFSKVIATDAKDAKSGAKPGGIYHMQGEDSQQRTFMVKRGNGLGDTISELLVDIEAQETAKKLGNQEVTNVARTHLVIENTTHHNIEEFGKHLFLASEFSDSDYAVEAFKLGGFTERPKALSTRHGEFFSYLGYLNQKCDLKLEIPLLTAMNTRDIDFHTGNVILNFSTNTITDSDKRAEVLELIDHFKKTISDYASKEDKTPESDAAHWEKLATQVNAIKEKGGVVFFQKIDHGYGYNNYGKILPLHSSSIFNPSQMIFGKTTDFEKNKLKVGTQPSNHIAEFTEKHRIVETLLTKAGCEAILQNPPKQQIEILKKSLELFYARLNLAAKHYEDADVAEMHLLKSFYSHATGMRYRAEGGSIEDIKESITTYLIHNRRAHLHAQAQFIKEELAPIVQKIEQNGGPKTETEKAQQKLLQELNKQLDKKMDGPAHPSSSQSPDRTSRLHPLMDEIQKKGGQQILKTREEKHKPRPPSSPRPK